MPIHHHHLGPQLGSKQLAPGQYQVPFSFTLPHTLPGVFAEEEGFNGSDNYRSVAR